MESRKKRLYYINRSLDEPRRIVGLPTDEFVTGMIVFVVLLALKKSLLAFLSGVIVIAIIRYFKKGKGSGWLLSLIYWHFPKWISKLWMKHTPPSENREYIS